MALAPSAMALMRSLPALQLLSVREVSCLARSAKVCVAPAVCNTVRDVSSTVLRTSAIACRNSAAVRSIMRSRSSTALRVSRWSSAIAATTSMNSRRTTARQPLTAALVESGCRRRISSNRNSQSRKLAEERTRAPTPAAISVATEASTDFS